MRKVGNVAAPLALFCGVLALLALAPAAPADVFNLGDGNLRNLEFVTVGDPGNAADIYTGYNGNHLGSVAYTYKMGKYDVTAAQYCQFLNAVATQSDPYGLYSYGMAGGPGTGKCGITRTGSEGSYSYSTTSSGYAVNNGNFPVNFVSWGSAARFANWLTNGQPVGPAGPGTTETGSYTLNGATQDAALSLVTRNPSARYVIPTEDEWYKAAYYKGGSTNAGYWLYPTESNSPPSHVLSATGTNNANYYNAGYSDPVNLLTEVGAFASSPGPYGTFDMGGDVWQWNETNFPEPDMDSRGLRGGTFFYYRFLSPDVDMVDSLMPNGSSRTTPNTPAPDIGFRVAEVPEPSAMFILALSCLGVTMRRKYQS